MEYSDIEQLHKLIIQRGANSLASKPPAQARFSLQAPRLPMFGADVPFHDDSDGGLAFDESSEQPGDANAEEPIYFDQTTRHMGSV